MPLPVFIRNFCFGRFAVWISGVRNMAEEKKKTFQSNNIIVENRQSAMFSGVVDVSGFNENCINMFTDVGGLVLKGSGLHIVRLSLETGDVAVEGRIDSLIYSDKERPHTEGFISRLFR